MGWSADEPTPPSYAYGVPAVSCIDWQQHLRATRVNEPNITDDSSKNLLSCWLLILLFTTLRCFKEVPEEL